MSSPVALEGHLVCDSACSPLRGQEGRRPQTARVITRCNLKNNGYPAHHPPLPGTINPVCATREYEGLAWPPRLSALRQSRRRFPEVSTLTKGGRDLLTAEPARTPQYPGSLARPRRSAARESLGSR